MGDGCGCGGGRRRGRVGVRLPPSAGEAGTLFGAWRASLPRTPGRGFLVAARDYVAASLWRRVGLRINETVRLEVGDWYPQWERTGCCMCAAEKVVSLVVTSDRVQRRW